MVRRGMLEGRRVLLVELVEKGIRHSRGGWNSRSGDRTQNGAVDTLQVLCFLQIGSVDSACHCRSGWSNLKLRCAR